jgi:uncharacterized protein (DUF4213/DUF364 family)
MKLVQNLLSSIKFRDVVKVRIGLNWTAVVIVDKGREYCGLASTVRTDHTHDGESRIDMAGQMENYGGEDLANLCLSPNITLRSVGIAALNAHAQLQMKESWFEANADEVIAKVGRNKRVAMVGRFPFTERLRSRVKQLQVLEQTPGPYDYPASQADEVIPNADVVAITGMTLINQTMEDLLDLCQPNAFVMVLGPSAPLSPVLFDYGVDVISGAIVENVEPVLRVVMQGGNFRQVHQAGVRLVNIGKF